MEDNKDVEKAENSVEQPEKEEATKTYTKEDLDNSFNAGVKKANSDWQKDEKYKEFLEWKKNKQSSAERMAELEENNEKLTKENSMLKATSEVAKSDVKPEFLKFVTTEVMSLSKNGTDFEAALKSYKKDNPQYFGEVVVKKVQSSPNLNNGGSQETTTNSIMNDILRGVRK